MATYQIVTNIATTTSGGHAFVPAVPNFAQFRLLSSKEGETIIGAVPSPLGLPQTFKFGCRRIQNIYTGTGIDPGLFPPVRSGVSVVWQTNETWSMKDPDDGSLPEFAVPVEAHTVLRIPNNELITLNDLLGLLQRQAGAILDTDLSALAGLIRGATNPLLLV